MADCEARLSTTLFPVIDRRDLVRRLCADGVAFGLRAPEPLVAGLVKFAQNRPCFADRMPDRGFMVMQRAMADVALKKPILVAQYFNTEEECPEISILRKDPVLQWIAAEYLQSVPRFVGANMWWTFPVVPLQADRDQHAHLFHRDVDDFRFLKFFFYLTDVDRDDGAHVCVAGSHMRLHVNGLGDRWNIRRYSDKEVEARFASAQVLEICGAAGTGFAENTLCIHKALTPTKRPRLLLQLQYALFDYGVMHDRRDASSFRMLVE
jgi:hypothetical protein